MTILRFGGTDALEEKEAGGRGGGQEAREVPRWKRRKKEAECEWKEGEEIRGGRRREI